MNNRMNIYLTGVGGQGIGLLSEAILRACDHAGLPCKGVDTHGLAQRGGIVESHIRVGEDCFSPLIEPGTADLVLALERTEALRALCLYCREGGTLLYYDTLWQSLPLRLGEERDTTEREIQEQGKRKRVTLAGVRKEDLPDTRMQNVVLLSEVIKRKLIPGVNREDYVRALEDLLPEKIFSENLELLSNLVISRE